MRLYIVRHGKAEQDAPSGRDIDRPLRPKGVLQAKHLGRCIALAQPKPTLILTSGYARAIHTATIIQAALECRLDSAVELESGKLVSDAIELIGRHTDVQTLMLVGHNPQLGMLVGALTKGLGASELLLKTGEAVVLDIPLANPIGSGRVIDRLRLEELPLSPGDTNIAGGGWITTPSLRLSLRR